MAKYIKFDDIYEMLHSIGGCDAEPESFADGWDKATDTAIKELADIPAIDKDLSNEMDLKPCPFCGKVNTYSEFYRHSSSGGYEIRIGCTECKYYLKTGYLSKGDNISIKEITDFTEKAAQKWNTRRDKI